MCAFQLDGKDVFRPEYWGGYMGKDNNRKNRKVLLLGNGINRAYNGDSWVQMIREFSGNQEFRSSLPMPQQIIVATDNRVDEKLKDYKDQMYGEVIDEEFRAVLRLILTAGFDEIITTNYSYELEISASKENKLNDNTLTGMQDTTDGRRAERIYMLHTYNKVEYSGVQNRVWHIHGEARKPSSMVIGQYYYGNLVSRYKQHFEGIKDKYERAECFRKELKYNSWLDSFIMGDVYVLGFGFDPAEIDLWWLLERKKRERATKGKVYFYIPKWETRKRTIKDKLELLRCHGVERPQKDLVCTKGDYKEFYYKAIVGIREELY